MVAENRRGAVVGFALAHLLRQGRAHIVTLDVLPRYRGRGLGRELIEQCEDQLRAGGARRVRLETAAANRAAQALYLSLGYTYVERLVGYYPDGQDAWLMEKSLEQQGVRP